MSLHSDMSVHRLNTVKMKQIIMGAHSEVRTCCFSMQFSHVLAHIIVVTVIVLLSVAYVIVITWTRGRWLIYCTRARSARGP